MGPAMQFISIATAPRLARSLRTRPNLNGQDATTRMIEILGWGSSIVLVFTIATQVSKQWRAGTSEGVSPLLFIGQAAASLGFTVYSVLLGNWIFTVTNALMLLAAIIGLFVYLRFKR